MDDSLDRFVKAQDAKYQNAFHEIRSGRKSSHWMWFIFPQIAGLGHSDTAKFYAIKDLEEAERYLNHPVLGPRLIEISNLLLAFRGRSANEIFGKPDDLKLKSCMTLFHTLKNSHTVFKDVIDQYFGGKMDERTLEIVSKEID